MAENARRAVNPDLTVLGVVGDYIRENRLMFVIYCSILIVYPIQTVVVPIFYGRIISGIQQKTSLVRPLVAILILVIVVQLGNTAGDFVEVRMFPSLQAFIRTRIINYLFAVNRTNLEDLKVGEMITKIIKLPSAMYGLIDSWKMFFIPEFVVYVAVIVYFMVVDWKVAVALALVLGTFVYSVWASVSRCQDVSWQRDIKFNVMHEEVDDVLRNMISVLNSNQEESEIDRIGGFQDEFVDLSKRSLNCAIWIRVIFTPVIIAGLAGFMAYAFFRMRRGLVEPSLFLTMFIIIMFVANSMWKIISQMKDVVVRWGIVKESMYLLEPRTAPPSSGPRPPGVPGVRGVPGAPVVAFDRVSFSYGAYDVLRDVSFEIEAGRRTLIVGPIGSGKSTVLKMIMMYKLPSSGVITLDGVPLTDLGPGVVRDRIAYIPQLPMLLNRTLLENILYGNDRADEGAVVDMIHGLRLDGVFSMFPAGLRTMAGKNGSNVSGGQRQIVWILRAMLHDPTILLLDEPTASLDEETKSIVNDLLNKLMARKTCIIVTHDKFLIEKADRVVTLTRRDGRIRRPPT